MGRGKQYIQLIKVLFCKLLTICKKLPTFSHGVWGLNYRPQRREESLLQLRHHDMSACLHRMHLGSQSPSGLANLASNHRLSLLCEFSSDK